MDWVQVREKTGPPRELYETTRNLASTLEGLLDGYATDTPAVRAAYRRAMNLELAFFEANS